MYSEIHVQSVSNYTVHEAICFYCTVYIFYIHIQCTGTLMFPFLGSKLLTAMKGGKIISSVIKINVRSRTLSRLVLCQLVQCRLNAPHHILVIMSLYFVKKNKKKRELIQTFHYMYLGFFLDKCTDRKVIHYSIANC